VNKKNFFFAWSVNKIRDTTVLSNGTIGEKLRMNNEMSNDEHCHLSRPTAEYNTGTIQ